MQRNTIRYDHHNLCPDMPGIRFNASIIETEGGYLYCFRNSWIKSEIYGCWLNEDFTPTGKWAHIKLPDGTATRGKEDPRFFRHNGELWMSYNGFTGRGTSVLYVKLNEKTLQVEKFGFPQLMHSNRYEKSWVCFSHNNLIHAVYSIKPHVVLTLSDFGEGEDPWADRAYTTPFEGTWTGGFLRGGCSPILHNGYWWHFFHGCYRDYDHGRRVYNAGIVVFEKDPPFQIVRYTPQPFDVASLHDCPDDVKVYCLFPGGVVKTQDQFAIAYGVHDSWTEIRFYDQARLESLLKDV